MIFSFLEIYVDLKSEYDIEIHHPIDHNIKRKNISELYVLKDNWLNDNTSPLSTALQKSHSETDIRKIGQISSSFKNSLSPKHINTRYKK